MNEQQQKSCPSRFSWEKRLTRTSQNDEIWLVFQITAIFIGIDKSTLVFIAVLFFSLSLSVAHVVTFSLTRSSYSYIHGRPTLLHYNRTSFIYENGCHAGIM